jgi:hypothetical protein
MTIKYFFYVSKTKVDMISAQLPTKRFSLDKFEPKVEFAGATLGITYQGNEVTNLDLISRTIKLISQIDRQKLTKPLSTIAKSSTSFFYHDENEWFHGLYSFRNLRNPAFRGTSLYPKKDPLVVIYVMFRIQGRKLFLMFGSPNHILGEKEVNYGTVNKPIELTTMRTLHLFQSFKDVEETAWHNWDTDSEEETISPDMELVFPRRRAEKPASMQWEVPRDMPNGKGYLLSRFCLKELVNLPRVRIDTLLRIYSVYEHPSPEWESLYLGSPIYTALP